MSRAYVHTSFLGASPRSPRGQRIYCCFFFFGLDYIILDYNVRVWIWLYILQGRTEFIFYFYMGIFRLLNLREMMMIYLHMGYMPYRGDNIGIGGFLFYTI